MNSNKEKRRNIIATNGIKVNPAYAAVVSKLVVNKEDQRNKKTSVDIKNNLSLIASETFKKITDNEQILDLFPDIGICIQMLCGSITAPNDLVNTNIIYKIPKIPIPDSLKEKLVNEIKDYIEETYQLESNLSTIVKESLFTKGAYVEAIVPEASLDDIINKSSIDGECGISLESEKVDLLRQKMHAKVGDGSFGYLSSPGKSSVSLESYDLGFFKDKIEQKTEVGDKLIVNNNGVSKEILFPRITDDFRLFTNSIREVENIAMETFDKNFRFDKKIERDKEQLLDAVVNTFFKKQDENEVNEEGIVNVSTIDEASRKSIGAPLTFKVPVETIIPVHAPNDTSKHVGYFVLLDDNGGLINGSELNSARAFDENNVTIGGRTNNGASVAERAKRSLEGFDLDDSKLSELETLYSDIVEDMIRKRLIGGSFKELVDLQDNVDIYRIMFFRALKNKRTNLVFLPAELVAYYAFEYRENGTGKSLLEKVVPLTSIRALVFISTILATITNAINEREVDVTIDEDSADPFDDLELVVDTVMKGRDSALPIGITKLMDLQDWATRSQYKFNITHPDLPSYQIKGDDTTRNVKVPDSELEDKIMEKIILSFYLTPEMLKQGLDPEFASTVNNRHALYRDRVVDLQKTLSKCLSAHVGKYIKSDQNLRNRLHLLINSNKNILLKHFTGSGVIDDSTGKGIKITFEDIKYYIFQKLEDTIIAELPKPEVSDTDTLLEIIRSKFDKINNVFDECFSSDINNDVNFGVATEDFDNMINILKSKLKTKTIIENNVLPELTELLTRGNEFNDNNQNIFLEFRNDVSVMLEKFSAYIKETAIANSKFNPEYEKLKEFSEAITGSEEDDSSGGDSGGDTGGSDEGDSGDTGGDEGMDGMDGLGGDDGGDSGSDISEDGMDLDFGGEEDDEGDGGEEGEEGEEPEEEDDGQEAEEI